MNTFWNFGDSWADVSWSDPSENIICYSEILANKLNLNHRNFGRAGSSLGTVTAKFLKYSESFQTGDYVFIMIPSDVRFYRTPSEEERNTYGLGDDPYEFLNIINSISDKQIKQYNNLLELISYDLNWFKFHHSLFLTLIYHTCTQKNVKFLMQHNYGNLELYSFFYDQVDLNSFVDIEESFLKKLVVKSKENLNQFEIDGVVKWKTYNKNFHDGPSFFNGKKMQYFRLNDNHPDKEGHELIADIIYDKFLSR